ncbi:MAG: substrate-binding domain-containing protein [Muribaculaceae bacterium]|nr:substrate-binding domain-containing protein [Muribaculaceae bacterium]
MNQKLLYFLLTLLASISLSSCGGSGERIYRIGVSQCSSDDWREKMNEEIRREKLFHDNVEVTIVSADDNIEKQIADIDSMRRAKMDVIVVAPIEAEAITPAIRKAHDSGVKVVVFDRDTSEPCYDAFQGADNKEIGRQAARLAVSQLGAKLNIIEISGLPGSSPAKMRYLGFHEVIDSMPGCRVIASVPANWLQEDAERVTDSLLAIYPDVDLIFSHNDRMAIGAANVAQRMKRDGITFYGIDAAPEIGLKAVAEKKIDATFLYPTEGERLLRTAIHIAKNEPFDSLFTLKSPAPITISNAPLMLLQSEALADETDKIEYLHEKVNSALIRYTSQHTLLTFAATIIVLLALLIFGLLRLFWTHRRHRLQLDQKNYELDAKNRELDSKNHELVERSSQLERSHSELDKLYHQLNEATSSKLTFYTNVSHDLRTPLTLIADPVAQLAGAENLTGQQRRLMQLADKNVKVLLRLVNQILDFRRAESGMLQMRLTEENLPQLIGEWSELFVAAARRHLINLKVERSTPAGFTMGVDREKMERVFFNLLSNAFKHTGPNGDVTVTVTGSSDTFTLTVSDTGEGIPASDLTNIFERFFQSDKINPNGSGIGLALTKTFVEMHGGSITVDSTLGKGSVFTVTIPVIHVEEEASEAPNVISEETITEELTDVEPVAPANIDSSAPTVLIIDDNPDIRALVSTILADDYTVIQAESGAKGIRLASLYQPDLVICDVMMPGMDGMETTSRLKSEATTSGIPVLMLTACSDDEQRAKGYEAGVDGYLSKPFNSDVLRARIKSLIANRKRTGAEDTQSIPDRGLNFLQRSDAKELADNQASPASPAPLSQIDDDLFRRFLALLKERMSESELSVDDMASELGLSRVQFYRRIKQVSNYSPAELLKIYRLRRADQLLRTTASTVSEVAYAVGFASPSYFTKCYREAYGEAPTSVQNRTSKI